MTAQRIGYWHPRRGYARVKIGFSWPAFFLGAVWAVAKGLWAAAAVMALLDVALWFAAGVAGAHGEVGALFACVAARLAYLVLRGRWANGWWRARLERLGYRARWTS